MDGKRRYHELKATINGTTSASHGMDRVYEVAIETMPEGSRAAAREHCAKHGGISVKRTEALGGDPAAHRAAKREYDRELTELLRAVPRTA